MSDTKFHNLCIDEEGDIRTADDTFTLIGSVYDPVEDDDYCTDDYRNLFAAAPKLYAQLEKMARGYLQLVELQKLDKRDESYALQYAHEANAVLAKARGERS